jgi:hypothetical protein
MLHVPHGGTVGSGEVLDVFRSLVSRRRVSLGLHYERTTLRPKKIAGKIKTLHLAIEANDGALDGIFIDIERKLYVCARLKPALDEVHPFEAE